MASKRPSTGVVSKGKRPNGSSSPRNGRGGVQKRRPTQEVVIVEKKSNTATWALVIAVSVVGLFLGTLLILDMTANNNQAGQPAAPAANQQGPTIQQLEAAVQAQPTNVSVRLQLAYAYIRNNQLDQGQEQVDTVLKADPKNYQALDYAGLIAQGKNNPTLALKLFDQGLASNPADKVDLLWDKGNLLMSLKRYKEAIPVFQEFAGLPRIKGTSDEQTALNAVKQAQTELAAQK